MSAVPMQMSSGLFTFFSVVSMLFSATLMVFLVVCAWRLMRAHERLAQHHDELVRALREPVTPPQS